MIKLRICLILVFGLIIVMIFSVTNKADFNFQDAVLENIEAIASGENTGGSCSSSGSMSCGGSGGSYAVWLTR